MIARIEAFLRDVFIVEPTAALRDEDVKKARELAGFLVELERLLSKTRRLVTIVDAAAGKSYLGLLVASVLAKPVHVIAIERNERIAAAAGDAAGRVPFGHASTRFEARVGDVGDARVWPTSVDLVVGLHTCGPAFDAAVTSAIAHEATHIALVPCCTGAHVAHHADALRAAEALGVPRQAEVRNRFTQAYIDAYRTLTLEAAGYEVEVVAFVPPTLTPHNLLWRARRVGEPVRMERAKGQLARLSRA